MNTTALGEFSDSETRSNTGRFERGRGERIVHKPGISALMHSDKMHSCRYRHVGQAIYTGGMQDRQRTNVEWMRDVMRRHKLNAAQWAAKACEVSIAKGEPCTLTGPTITRAMKEQYNFITKATTLAQLAAAVGENPPAEPHDSANSLIPLPSVKSLQAMLKEHHASITKGVKASDEMISDLARRMHDSLLSLQDDPAAARVPEAARSAALHIGRAHDR